MPNTPNTTRVTQPLQSGETSNDGIDRRNVLRRMGWAGRCCFLLGHDFSPVIKAQNTASSSTSGKGSSFTTTLGS
jgi:hypothetical protein